METRSDKSRPRISAILLDRSSWDAFSIFNPNDWLARSRSVVQSCSTELSILQYGANRIAAMCDSRKELTRQHCENLKAQWDMKKWDLDRSIYFAQVPEMHVSIEAFFSGLKTLLDLTVKLLSTEEVVGAQVNGFHREGRIYGGRVLNALERNSRTGKGPLGKSLLDLIVDHKRRWIDQVVSSRDFLVHPPDGTHQVMFELKLENHNGALVFSDVLPPRIGGLTITEYAARQLVSMKEFAREFLVRLRATAHAA